MLIEFSIENYRSFRERQVLSMLPDEGKQELEKNLIATNANIKLLRSAVLYGPNASGKSNLMKAMLAMRNLVLFSGNNGPEKSFKEYEPFRFHTDTSKAPVTFGIYILLNGKRFHYQVSILEKEVVYEQLSFYPQGREAKLFHRKGQEFEFGDYLKGQKAVVANLTAPNQLFVSKGALNNIQQLIEVFHFFENHFMTIPFMDSWVDNYYANRIAKELKRTPGKEAFMRNFENLLMSFDTGIAGFSIEKNHISTEESYEIFVDHYVFNSEGEKIDKIRHPIAEESKGTQKLFVLGGLILRALMNGRVITIDEFERSLHPFITAFIIQLFHDAELNAKGAQLVIATHDTNLLDSSELRRDQVWIIEKDLQGASSLFSLADIAGVRSNAPFEKWYLSGRFGGVPGIERLNFELNFQYEET